MDNVSPAVYKFVLLCESAWETTKVWRKRNRDRNQLASLNDRLLRDIGLTRAEVDLEINKPFWK